MLYGNALVDMIAAYNRIQRAMAQKIGGDDDYEQG